MAKEFSENFRRLRAERGVTQKWIAGRLGVTPDTVSSWARGKTTPDAATMAALADLLGTSTQELLGGAPPAGPWAPVLGRTTAGPLAEARPGGDEALDKRLGPGENGTWIEVGRCVFGDVEVIVRRRRRGKPKDGAEP